MVAIDQSKYGPNQFSQLESFREASFSKLLTGDELEDIVEDLIMDAFENMFNTKPKPNFRPNYDLNRNPYGHHQTINNNFAYGSLNKPYQHYQPTYQVQQTYPTQNYQTQPHQNYLAQLYQPKPTLPKPYQPYQPYQQNPNPFNTNHQTINPNHQLTQTKNSDQIPENLRCNANNRYRRQARIIGGTKVWMNHI